MLATIVALITEYLTSLEVLHLFNFLQRMCYMFPVIWMVYWKCSHFVFMKSHCVTLLDQRRRVEICCLKTFLCPNRASSAISKSSWNPWIRELPQEESLKIQSKSSLLVWIQWSGAGLPQTPLSRFPFNPRQPSSEVHLFKIFSSDEFLSCSI